MDITQPIVHYVRDSSGGPDYPLLCRNAIVTETSASGDILDPEGIRFKRGIYYAPPPGPGGGTWHHLDECDRLTTAREGHHA